MIIQKKQKFLIILSAFLLSLLFIYLAKNNFLVKYDFLETSEIISPDISDSTKLIFTPIVDTNGSLTNSGLVINNITPQNPAEILIPFKQTIFLDGLSVYFYGDLHSATSTPPKKFAIYYADQDNNWHLISRVNEYNNKPLYNLLFSNTIKTNVIKIVISEAVTDNSVWLQDLRFYSKQKTNLLTGLINYFDTYKYSLPAYWVYYLIFLSLLFIPGLTLITFFNQRKKFNLDISLLLLLSPLISLIIMFTGTVVYLLTGWALALNFYIFVFILSLVVFIKKRLYLYLFKDKFTIIFTLSALLLIFLTIAYRDYLFNLPIISQYTDRLQPIPIDKITYFADNLFPWRIARVYLHRLSLDSPLAQQLLTETTIFDRTPALPLITTAILSVFGESHFIYERFLEVLACLYYASAFVIIRYYFSQRIAIITLILMLLNIQLSLMPFNVEYFYKYFSLYPLFIAIAIFLKYKTPPLFIPALFIGFSFLIHPHTLIYSISFLILIFFRYSRPQSFKYIFPAIFTIIFLLSTWYFLPKLFHLSASNSLSYSFYFKEATTFPAKLLTYKLINLGFLFVPNLLLTNPTGGQISVFSNLFRFEFLRYSLISNLTPLFFILASIHLIKKIKKNYPFIILGMATLFIYWALYLHQYNFFYHYGGGYFLLYPFVLPFILSSVIKDLDAKTPSFKLAAIVSYLLFMVINLYYISGLFVTIKHFSPTINILFTLILMSYLSFSLLLFKVTFSQKKT